MKKTIIALCVAVIFAALFSSVFFLTGENKIMKYDCAENYDIYRDIYYNNWDPNQGIQSQNNYATQAKMAEKENELFDNSCFITIENWAHQSKYEQQIWELEWQKIAENNKKYLAAKEKK